MSMVGEGVKQARALRRELEIGAESPIDILWAAEKLGIIVVFRPLADLSGIHLAHASGHSVVGINSNEGSLRQHFTLAHEIAHHLFDRKETIAENIDFGDRNPMEQRANAFAAEFILPEQAIKTWAHTPHLKITPQEVALLALQYGLSFIATLWRLKSCGIVSDIKEIDANRAAIDPDLRARLSRRSDRPVTLPANFVRMANQAFEKGIISKKRYAALLHGDEDEPIT